MPMVSKEHVFADLKNDPNRDLKMGLLRKP